MDSGELDQFISLRQTGEMKVRSDVIMNLNRQLCKASKCSCIHLAHKRLRRESKAKIKTFSTYYPDVFSVPKCVIKQWARSINLVSVPGLYSDLDLDKGKYEGGFKVWESTRDLIKFITENQDIMNQLLHRGEEFKCLELGAGAALPTLALLSRLIGDPDFKSDYRIHVQDYNWQVLASLTLLNFAINLPSDYFKALIDSKSLRLFFGDWRNFSNNFSNSSTYDLIMMSEVIYNHDNYEALHNLLDRHLKKNGYIVIATKDTYFGLTGGIYSWLEYLDSKKIFNSYKMIKVSTINIPRSILIMRRLIS